MPDATKLHNISQRLANLSDVQIDLIDDITNQLSTPPIYERKLDSDLISDGILWSLGDSLRIHHCFSAEAFTKDRFEYALERAANTNSVKAVRASRGNPGHDLTIAGTAYSLKSQANAAIKDDFIHISKFMELGKGVWTDQLVQLDDLREQMFKHMKSYERIITLRRLKSLTNEERYELVEIPKSLLMEAASGKMAMMSDSRQSPKPGTCRVLDEHAMLKFELYFDGGTERKLQIRHIRKSLCVIHATWRFPANQPIAL